MKLQLVLQGLSASVETKTIVVLTHVFHILQSTKDISVYHTFFSALQATSEVKQKSGDLFHRYKVCNCVAILHSLVCGLAILRVLHKRLAKHHLELEVLTGIIRYSGENKVSYTVDLFMARNIAVLGVCRHQRQLPQSIVQEWDSTQAVHHFYGHSMKAPLIRSTLTRQVRQLT